MYTCHRCRQEVRDIRTLTVACGVVATAYFELGIGGSFNYSDSEQALLVCKDCRGEFLEMMGRWYKEGYNGKRILCISEDSLASRMYDKLVAIVDHTRVKLSLTNHDPEHPDRWVLRVACNESAFADLYLFVQHLGATVPTRAM